MALSDSLVAHFLLNNNADDNVGVFDGTPSVGVDFQGDVAYFDGVDSEISCGDLDLSTNFTISLWVKLDAPVASGTYNILGKAIPSTSGYMIYVDNSNNYQFYGYGLSVAKIETTSTQSTAFVHLVVTYDGVNLKLYHDGVLEATVVSTGTVTANANPMQFAYYNAGLNYLATKISNTRFYSDAKDQIFIDDLFAEGYYPKPLTLPTTTGLIAHYPLTGTAEDSTGTYDGTESNTYIDDIEFGSVADFNGTSDNIRANNLGALTAFTICGWIKNDTLTNSAKMITIANDDDTMLGWIGTGNTGDNTSWDYGFVGTNTVTRDAISVITTGEWSYYLLKYDGTNLIGYLDAVEVFSDLLTASFTDAKIAFSIRAWGVNGFLDGRIRDSRIYNRAITAQEIIDIYNYEKNFRTIDIDDGLIAYYPLKNNSSDNYYNELDATDSAGVTYDGSQATIPNTDTITFPTATGFVEAYYIKDGVFLTTLVEADLDALTNCTLSEVRKYNKSLTPEQIAIITPLVLGGEGDASFSLTATADASVSYGNKADASFSLTGTATPYVKGEADASFSLTGIANAAAVIRGKADASFSLVGSAAATTYEALPITIGFRFVQEIEQSLIQIPFKFVQEIEQAVPTTIIQRVNI